MAVSFIFMLMYALMGELAKDPAIVKEETQRYITSFLPSEPTLQMGEAIGMMDTQEDLLNVLNMVAFSVIYLAVAAFRFLRAGCSAPASNPISSKNFYTKIFILLKLVVQSKHEGVVSLKWGFILELKQSLRSKKLVATFGIMLLLYVPFFYILKQESDVSGAGVGEVIERMIQFIGGMSMFFIAILALLMGATAINSEIEKGTLRIAMSKPISRLAYMAGKMLAQVTILFIALAASSLIAMIGFASLGVSISSTLVKEVFLLNFILLFGLLQLLFLGYLLSTVIKSSSTALGLALVLFFVIFMIAPSIVSYLAYTQVSPGESPGDKYTEYATKYLFFDPGSQVNVLLMSTEERECYKVVRVYNVKTHEERVLNVTPVKSCNFFVSGSSKFYRNETTITHIDCECNSTYAGIAHSVGKHSLNLLILVSMTVIYSALSILRFLRMDLR